MAQGKIRIRLKGYDHQQLDRSAQQIVDTAQRSGATITGPVPLPTEKNVYCVIRSPVQGQGLARALRGPYAQAADRHPQPDAEDDRPADAARSARRNRHRDQALAMKGIIGKKLGMTQLFDPETGAVTAVTVIAAGPCPVVQVKTEELDGYDGRAARLRCGSRAQDHTPELGHLKRFGVGAHRTLVEFRGGIDGRSRARRSPSSSSRRATRSRSRASASARVSRARSSGTTSPAARARTARTTSAPRARSVHPRRPRGCSRASRWRAEWAGSASPSSG